MPPEFHRNYSLKDYNTFGVEVLAHTFIEILKEEELTDILTQAERKPWILGGGSNILLTGNVDRLVVRNSIGGIAVVEEDSETAVVRIGGGVEWHTFVEWTVYKDYGGVENLALIPGNTGAAPIQNIGAYGVELKDTFVKLDAIDLHSGHKKEFRRTDCNFGYRNSVFKNDLKEKLCITQVYLRLNKVGHKVNTTYGNIAETLEKQGKSNPGIGDVFNAVVSIRRSKLPDPKELGNSGSFFKNPIISTDVFSDLQKDFPSIISYPEGEDYVKVPAGWLIEQCGWRGKRLGNVGCYEKQALVIVNYGGATGQEIYDFAMSVRESVRDEFGIELEPEVNVV